RRHRGRYHARSRGCGRSSQGHDHRLQERRRRFLGSALPGWGSGRAGAVPGDRLMREAIDSFTEFVRQEKGFSANTLAAYRNDLNQFVDYVEATDGEIEVPDRATIVNFMSHLREREYAASTIARRIAAVKSFFHYLQSQGAIAEDPTRSLPAPRVARGCPRSISVEEIDKLLQQPKANTPMGMRDK